MLGYHWRWLRGRLAQLLPIAGLLFVNKSVFGGDLEKRGGRIMKNGRKFVACEDLVQRVGPSGWRDGGDFRLFRELKTRRTALPRQRRASRRPRSGRTALPHQRRASRRPR
ncbi:hypothetical protein AVEN_174262-1, partial [Araneus ventricosus]